MLIVTAWCVWHANPQTFALPNRVLLSLLGIHYFNRSLRAHSCTLVHGAGVLRRRTVIFPLRIRGGKPSPITVVLLAFLFCTVNGYIQARRLSARAVRSR